MSAEAILDALAGLVDTPIAMAASLVADGEQHDAYDLAHETSRFEFGSIGKTMTAQVLAALVREGVVSLDDAIGAWLDGGPNGDITLRQLATHTSGLPRMAPNAWSHAGYDDADPYAAFTAEVPESGLRDAVRSEASEYSNFGLQLLGLALERVTGTTLASLMTTHVFGPSGMGAATVGPGPNQVQGFADGQRTHPWTLLLPGPGGVCGTLADLVAWGRAVLDPSPTMQFVLDNNLAWRRNGPLLWHNGGTEGGHACLAIHPANRRIAATLVATSDIGHVDDATFLACVGRDPMDARPIPVDGRFDAAAVEVCDLLGGYEWDALRERMTPSCAATLTVERVSEAWVHVMGPRGAYVSAAAIRASRANGAIAVQADLTFSDGVGQAEVSFNDDGLVIGLRIA